MSSPTELANQRMVDRLIAEGALWSSGLIDAFRHTPRHLFLDRVFQYQRKHNRWREIPTHDPGPEELELLYSDRALITRLSSPAGPAESADRSGRLDGSAAGAEAGVPISSSSQPSLMAQMLEDLRLGPGLCVLEVGAGTGYNAALLAHVVGPQRVWSVDVDRAVLAEARQHLQALPGRGVRLCHADGREGWPETAPFDRIMVTAATEDLEPAWLEQLAEGGICLAPLALAPGLAYVVCGAVEAGVFQGRLTRAAYFMPLRAEGEVGESDTDPIPLPDPIHRLKAPWATWFERRRPRSQWFHFIQALAFYGLLRGRNVHYRATPDGQALYGISAPHPDVGPAEAVCWLGPQEWRVNGAAGRDLGWGLWRAFLDAGGPWPTEFRLRASPTAELHTDQPQGFVRHGPRCRQVWELSETRDRPGWV